MSFFGQFAETVPPFGGNNNSNPYLSSMQGKSTNMMVEDEESDVIEDGSTFRSQSNFLQLQTLSRDFMMLKQENDSIKNAVVELQNDREKLRVAVRKLKAENNRFKLQLKRITGAVTSKRQNSEGDAAGMETDQADKASDILDDVFDFDDIGEFLLIGGPNDPLSDQYRAPIRDAGGIEHKSVERYLWYKMAENFDDKEAIAKILNTESPSTAEEASKNIKNFDQKAWDAVKMRHWEEAQRIKFDQYRSLKCLLVKTGSNYLALACQDKFFGTGWRKQRDEAARPQMWDGENRGGKILMKLRTEYAANHTWAHSQEEKEAQNSFYDNKRNVWRKWNREGGEPTFARGGGRGNRRMAPARSSTAASNPNFGNNSMRSQSAQMSYYIGNGANNMGWTPFQDFPQRPIGSGSRGGMNKRGRF